MEANRKEVDNLSFPSREVFILGAGFTKAFLPNAPLMVDDYEGDVLASKFREFPYASRVLDWERSRSTYGEINIERLMTRLEGRMPYDFDQKADEELGMLLVELKRNFIRRIRAAKEKRGYNKDLERFAEYCLENNITCITFNYDDVLDEAIWKAGKAFRPGKHFQNLDKPDWNPDSGYGFLCRHSLRAVDDTPTQMDTKPAMLLLKLHGSINWYPRRGYPQPYSVDAIMHNETWYQTNRYEELKEMISFHIEPDPFLVPPILIKSAIVEQPILRLLWHLAYDALHKTQKVTFVGYSCPLTDIAVRTLFEESLQLLPKENIYVVNVARGNLERQKIINAYREVFSDISIKQFNFGGALRWAGTLS